MAIIRTKDNVPQPYVSESRDFQLFTRILDVTQNATKFNIDSILDTLDTSTIPNAYIERLKSKLGFFTPHYYDNEILRNILRVFPSLIKYKGSEIGIERCVNTFLNTIGAEKGSRIDIYNKHDIHPYTIRIGVSTEITNITALKDMLSYIIPTGYFVEVYHYGSTKSPALRMVSHTQHHILSAETTTNDSIRWQGEDDWSSDAKTKSLQESTFNTVQLSTVYDPYENESLNSHSEEPTQEDEGYE